MPEFVYYIIGAVLAIVIMLVIILCNKKKNKKSCCGGNEDCCTGEHNHAHECAEDNAEVVEESEDISKTEEVTQDAEAEKQEEVEENNAETNNAAEESSVENQPVEKELSKKEKLNRYRVTYDKTQENWVVKMDGAARASKRCATKEEALKVAKELAKKKDSHLSVHKKDGKFQKKANIK